VGQAASMAGVLVSAGAKGKRNCLPHGRVMIHQGTAGVRGAPADIMIQVKEINQYLETLYSFLAKHTGQDIEKIRKDCDRDYFMSPAEAQEYGIIDKVLQPGER